MKEYFLKLILSCGNVKVELNQKLKLINQILTADLSKLRDVV